MRVAYADPPYPGQAKRLYGSHPDYAGEVDHEALIARLEGSYDAWALSTGSRMLQDVLGLCPPKVRLLCWVKPMAPPMGDGFMYGWEPVIVKGGRKPSAPMRDVVTASLDGYTFRARPDEDVTGSKPAAFARWLFEAMGLTSSDEFDDLFPGSGGVTEAWVAWSAQGRMPVEVGPPTRFAPLQPDSACSCPDCLEVWARERRGLPPLTGPPLHPDDPRSVHRGADNA